MAAHRMTPARRAALKKAQAASARKRRGKGKGKLASANRRHSRLKRGLKYTAIGVGTVAAVGAAHYANKRVAIRKGRKFTAPRTDFAKSNFKGANFGLSKRQIANGKRASAAAGSRGKVTYEMPAGKSKIKRPGGSANINGGQKRPKKKKVNIVNYDRRHQTRARQLHKASEVGMYRAGLSNYYLSNRKFVSGKGGTKVKWN